MKTILILLAAAHISAAEGNAPIANENKTAHAELTKSITFPDFAKQASYHGLVAAE